MASILAESASAPRNLAMWGMGRFEETKAGFQKPKNWGLSSAKPELHVDS